MSRKRTQNVFCNRSGAGFNEIIGAVDGMLVWSRMPTDKEFKTNKTGHGKFKCSRKGKYALNMQAACDSKRHFIWVLIITPGTISDYLAYVTSTHIKN